MALSPLQFFNGLSSLILVLIFTYVGIRIVLKYKKTKQVNFIYIGLTWIGVVEAYYSVSVSFIISWFNGIGLFNAPAIYFLIGLTFYPISTLIWVTGFTYFFLEDKRRLLQIIFVIIGVAFEVVFFYFLFTSPTSIGTLLSPVDSQFALLFRLYILFSLAVIFLTGMVIAFHSIKADEIEYKLRGYFLLITLVCFVIGAIFDSSLDLDIIWLTIIRLVLIISAICFYLAFMMPNWLVRRYTKS
jgi:hypothetical protein